LIVGAQLESGDYRAGFLFAVRSGDGGPLRGTLYGERLGSSSNGFLSFPLREYTPYTAPIGAVLDHSMPQGNCADGRIVAYTGEEGRRQWGESSWSTNNGCGTLRGYRNRNGTSFSIGGQYVDTGDGTRHLFYDGHTGYDYPRPNGTRVEAAAAGTAYHYNYGGEENVYIDHGNGYETYYVHLSERTIEHGEQVNAGEKVGEVGAGHLHFTVKKGGQRVDPYGWKGASGTDPLPVDGGDNVCLWTECQ
jgi:murein DD-endopeptidase MepM/ murein hydrolase activator NlpD